MIKSIDDTHVVEKSFLPFYVISTMVHFYHDSEEAHGIQRSIITSIPKQENIIFYMSLVSRKGWKLIVLLLFPSCLSFFLCTTWKTCASLNILVQFLVYIYYCRTWCVVNTYIHNVNHHKNITMYLPTSRIIGL